MGPSSWLPPILWMAFLFALSSDVGSGQHTRAVLGPLLEALLPWATVSQVEAVHFLVRKSAHVSVYAVLALLWFRLFRTRGRSRRAAAGLALAVAVAWAALDEARQSTVPSRTGAIGDVLIDGVGAGIACVAVAVGLRRALWKAAGLLLLAAAVGGTAVLASNLAAGTPSGILWFSVPAAGLAWMAWQWWSRD